jgi:hypothetical protein
VPRTVEPGAAGTELPKAFVTNYEAEVPMERVAAELVAASYQESTRTLEPK